MTDTPPSPTVAPAEGKLGVLSVGLGAVATTLIAGVELAKRGEADPVGSLTQMGTIRLGKRTDDNVPRIKDFVPLASLDDIVFGAWDPFPDDAYVAAKRAGVLDAGRHLEAISDALRGHPPDAGRLRPELREAHRRHQHHGEHLDKRAMLDHDPGTSAASRTRSLSTASS